MFKPKEELRLGVRLWDGRFWGKRKPTLHPSVTVLIPTAPGKPKIKLSPHPDASSFLKSTTSCSRRSAATSPPAAMGFISRSPGSDRAITSPLLVHQLVKPSLDFQLAPPCAAWGWLLAAAGRQMLCFRRERLCLLPLLMYSILSYLFLAVPQLNYCK